MNRVKPVTVACAFAAACLLLAALSYAQTAERWVTHGPWGGTVKVLVPSHHPDGGLYAGLHDDGVYFMPPGSNTWERRAEGLSDLHVLALVQHPTDPDILYAGTVQGVFWTTDGGRRWAARSGGIAVTNAAAIAFDPLDPRTLYAAAIWRGDWLVYKTTDAGETWANTGPGIPVGTEIRDVLVDPANPRILYASTEDPYGYTPEDVGIYKSINGGDTWERSGEGLGVPRVWHLAFDPTSSETIYAGTYSYETPELGGVYVSRDAGASWVRSSNGLPGNQWMHELLVLPGAGDSEPFLLAAMSYSLYSPPIPPSSPSGWDALLYQSVDGGRNWELASDGIGFPNVFSVAIDRDDPAKLYAGTLAGGAFRSLDGGTTWSHWSTGLQRLMIRDVQVHPENEDTLYASALYDGYYTSDAGVHVSFDGGLTWQPRLQNLHTGDGLTTEALAIAPGETEIIYAAHCGWNMFKSIDEGASWAWRGLPHGLDGYWLMDVIVDPRDPLVALTCSAGYPPCLPAIYRTADGGETWRAYGQGLSRFEFDCLAMDPTNSQIVYVGSAWEGVWKSTNGGRTWTETGPEIIDHKVSALVVDPASPQTVYAADRDWDGTGVYVSYDGGDSWQLFSDGLTDLTVWDLALDSPPVDAPAVLYASTHDGGVFRRVLGDDWEAINEGLTNLRVRSLALGPVPADDDTMHGRALYAGTDDGVYRRVAVGDLDGDGDVDLSDLAQLLAHYGTTTGATYEDGDGDGDGDVDLSDLAQLLSVYGM